MRKSPRPIVIASRRSLLARVQAEAVGRTLQRLHLGVAVEFRWIESEGDRKSDQSLALSGGKGLFAHAIEQALLDGQADLAVHSLKDLPVELTAGLSIAAIPKRGDARDCLVSPGAETIDQLPHGASVGTASPRRSAQLLRLRPDLQVVLLRGNVETRLRKVLDEHQVDATLLSMAGLKRARFARHADKPIDPNDVLPSAGQGALAIQCRTDDHVSMSRCLPLNDPATSAATHFERQVVLGLQGSCRSPIAVYAEPTDAEARCFDLRARVLSPDGQTCVGAEHSQARSSRLSRIADAMVGSLIDSGAAIVLQAAAPAVLTMSPFQPGSARADC